MTITLLSLVGGLMALLIGGELLVRGAVGLAERAGLTPLVIGLVIVGFGTSTPELVTSVEAALAGSPSIAWGNIVGSNIANMLLILGAAALVAPLVVRKGAAIRDLGVCLVASAALVAIAASGLAGAWLGGLMIFALGAYIFRCYREERQAAPEVVHNAPFDRSVALELSDAQLHSDTKGWLSPILLTLGGLAVLIVGGRFLVDGAIDLARMAGLSETLIGLTIVAVGTSLPELVTSLVAARKGQAEVAFGNVVGSNIYNILGIGGVTMLVSPAAIPASLLPFDLGFLLFSVVAVCGIVWIARGVGRWSGVALIAAYLMFLWIVIAQG